MMSPTLTTTSDNVTVPRYGFAIESGIPQSREAVPRSGQTMGLVDVVEHEAMSYRSRGTAAGDFLARQMDRLAQLVRWTGATTPEDHEARMEVWDAEIREQWFDRGYHEGYEAGRRDRD